MEFKLGGKTLLLWRIRVGLAFLLFAAAFVFFTGYSGYFLIPAAVTAAAGAGIIVGYLPAFFAGYRIFVGEKSVVVTYGVFIKTSRIMPFKRMVFAAGYSTPLARAMRLEGVVLRAARASVIIPEIGREAADRLISGIGGEKTRD